MRGKADRGFTLVEVMIVVAIIGILAGILVFSFDSQPKRIKSRSEVQAMFAEFHRAEAEYALERGSYYSTGAGASDMFPNTVSPQVQDVTSPPAEWTTLRINPSSPNLYCGYVAVAGGAADAIPAFATDFGMTQPTGNWYALYAECDMDGNSALNGTFFSSSVDPTTQRRNETK